MLVVAGETIVDLIEFEPRRFEAFNGGGPFNVAKAARKMGQETGYLSPISKDSFGDGFIEEMDGLGVVALSPRSPMPSGLAIVKKDETGHPSYDFIREVAADRDITLDALNAAMPKNPSAFYIGGLALVDGADAQTWTDFLPTIDCPIFVDPNIRPTFIKDRAEYLARLAKVYDAADIVKLSDEDIEWIAPNEDPRVYLEGVMKAHDVKLGLLTEGSKGGHWITSTGHGFAPAPKVKVIDTVGAGDCFSGATLSYLLRENALSEMSDDVLQFATEYAATAAAINCTRAGANAPTHDEIIAYT